MCSSAHACKGSISPDNEFWEGQLSHVGKHFDLTHDGRPTRIVVVGKENGRGPSHISLADRYKGVHDLRAPQVFSQRNNHMRGTTIALRLLLCGDLEIDHSGEFVTTEDGGKFHLFDGFALVNALLCSSVAPGRTDGRSSPEMRRNCLTHFERTLIELEPTVLVLQGMDLPSERWIGPALRDRRVLDPARSQLFEARVGGQRVVVCAFSHPQQQSHQHLRWDGIHFPYVTEVLRPTLMAALEHL